MCRYTLSARSVAILTAFLYLHFIPSRPSIPLHTHTNAHRYSECLLLFLQMVKSNKKVIRTFAHSRTQTHIHSSASLLIVANAATNTLQQQLSDLTQVENSQPFYIRINNVYVREGGSFYV